MYAGNKLWSNDPLEHQDIKSWFGEIKGSIFMVKMVKKEIIKILENIPKRP